MKGLFCLLSVCAAVTLSCADAQRSPAQPSGPLTPHLIVRIDGLEGAQAITEVSEVSFDASQTQGELLRIELTYGDGTSTTEPVSTHIYRFVGTFTATLVVTDAANRTAVATQDIVVRSVKGTWFQFGVNERRHRFETRRVSVNQDGTQVSGVYSFRGSPATDDAAWDGADQTITGHLMANRRISVSTADGSVRFQGSIAPTVDEGTAVLALSITGEDVDGQAIPFKPVPVGPLTTPPRARLEVRSGVPGAPGRIFAGWEATFDASQSTGDGLSYLIDFGDGQYAAGQTAVHVPNASGRFTTRAVIVDRFGRVDAPPDRLDVYTFAGSGGFENDFQNPATFRREHRVLSFSRQSGTRLIGAYVHPEGWTSPLTATLSGANRIQMRLDDGTIEFAGAYSWEDRGSGVTSTWLDLTIRGGSADGVRLAFKPTPSYPY